VSRAERIISAAFCLVLAVFGPLAARSVSADDVPLAVLEERAFQQAAAIADPSIVRIETIGGLDVVGETIAAAGPTSGVVVAADGWIITSSFNFVTKPSSIFVTTSDGKRFAATLAGKDEPRRLTLLHVEATDLKPLAVAPKAEFQVGQWAIALGRTFDPGFPNISVGIISALHRISGRAVQMDANTSPVNYGGALVDISGRGIGIIAPMSTDGDNVVAGTEYYDSGIGFAVPLEDVMAVLDRLKAGTTLKAGKIGVLFKEEGLLAGQVKIDQVLRRSPAEEAGLKPGDVITGVDGREIARAALFRQAIGPKYGGDKVTLKVLRGEQTIEAPITLADQIPPFEAGFAGIIPKRVVGESKDPVTVLSVLPESPAAKAGVQPGDQITAINGEPTPTEAEVRARLSTRFTEETVKFTLTTAGASREVSFALGKFPLTVPADLPPQTIPHREEDEANPADKPKMGRFVDSTVGDDRKFWAYVPDSYRKDAEYGLVVWLQPAGNGREAEMLERWKPVCEERGIILVAPPPAGEKWAGGDIPSVIGVVDWVKEKYHIDPQRIVLQGESEGGRLGMFLALRQRDKFPAVAMLAASGPAQFPEVEAEHPLKIHVSTFADDPQSRQFEKSFDAMREARYPVTLHSWPGKPAEGYPAESIQEIARWMELLDAL
jgi:serine protease Do